MGIISRILGIEHIELPQKKPRLLNEQEAELFADYFHNETYSPDYDGFVGYYHLPEEVMKIYIKKYGKERYE